MARGQGVGTQRADSARGGAARPMALCGARVARHAGHLREAATPTIGSSAMGMHMRASRCPDVSVREGGDDDLQSWVHLTSDIRTGAHACVERVEDESSSLICGGVLGSPDVSACPASAGGYRIWWAHVQAPAKYTKIQTYRDIGIPVS